MSKRRVLMMFLLGCGTFTCVIAKVDLKKESLVPLKYYLLSHYVKICPRYNCFYNLKQVLNMPIWFLTSNVISFQAIWFIAVLAGNSPLLFLCLPIILLHFFLLNKVLKKQFNWKNEIFLIVACVLLGVLVESIKLLLPVWDESFTGYLPPIWLLCIWAGFAISLHGSFAFLQNRFAISAFLGALFAPLSYFAGARLSDSYELADPSFGLLLIGALWVAVMPLLVWLAGLLPVHKSASYDASGHKDSVINAT